MKFNLMIKNTISIAIFTILFSGGLMPPEKAFALS